MSNLGVLRAVANRLTSTDIEELSHQIGFLANAITNCQNVLQSSTPTSDQSLIIHKLKTRTSSLLQDRTPDGRFCGIVIAKALVEAGGLPILSESGSWIRNLISCLNKPDPWEVRRICIGVITRIYILTVEHQQLVREITTPTLPAFISATLSVIKPTSSAHDGKTYKSLSQLLLPVLQSWHALIKHFAPTFRPNVSAIKAICLSLLSDASCEHSVQVAAEDVISSVHFCAPKNTAAADWAQSCSQAIEAAHDTADLVFRAVIEDYMPSVQRATKVTRKQKSMSVPSTSVADAVGLEKWTGISEGCYRLRTHLKILHALMTSPHAQQVTLPLAAVFDMTARLSAVTPPTSKFALRTNNEITRDEREELWLNLPRIHASIIELFRGLTQTFGQLLFPVTSHLSMQLWDILEAEVANEDIRSATYDLVASLLRQRLLQITKAESAKFRLLVNYCCEDLSPASSMSSTTVVASGGSKPTQARALTLDVNLTKSSYSATKTQSRLYLSAHDLLPVLLSHVPFHTLRGGSSLRANIDSTAIILNHHEAILASVLNPIRSRPDTKSGEASRPIPSLMPFLARSNVSQNSGNRPSYAELATEALLRPRQPVISATEDTLLTNNDKESSDEDVSLADDDDFIEQEEEPRDSSRMLTPVNETSLENLRNQAKLSNGATTAKRDFTTLLELHTDEQLAASALTIQERTENVDTNPEVVYSASKRSRVEEDTSRDEVLATATTQEEHQIWQTAPQPPAELPAPRTHISPMEDSDSSEDEIPPIDATLVGFDESDDEDESVT